MNIYKKIIEYIKEPSKLIVLLGMHKVGRILPDSSYIKCLYKTRTGKKLNLRIQPVLMKNCNGLNYMTTKKNIYRWLINMKQNSMLRK
jgi:hypothetical protein